MSGSPSRSPPSAPAIVPSCHVVYCAADDPNKVWALADLSARGEKIYAANCAVCHLPTGKGAGPIKALDG